MPHVASLQRYDRNGTFISSTRLVTEKLSSGRPLRSGRVLARRLHLGKIL